MFNVDDPGFPIALLAILAGLRLAAFVIGRTYGRTLETVPPVAPVLAPDETPEDAPILLPSTEPVTTANTQNEPPAVPPYRVLAELLDSGIIAVILVFFLIRPFVLQAFYIPSGSMEPTLMGPDTTNTIAEQRHGGDKLIASKFLYHLRKPRHGEVVVFHAPSVALEIMGTPYDPDHPVEYVKRVIGVPGDRIRIVANDGVYINDERQQEPYVKNLVNYDFPLDRDGSISTKTPAVRNQLQPFIHGNALVVPPGYLFVMGDNRQFSHDGHMWGLLDERRVIGKAIFIFWPPRRVGIIH